MEEEIERLKIEIERLKIERDRLNDIITVFLGLTIEHKELLKDYNGLIKDTINNRYYDSLL